RLLYDREDLRPLSQVMTDLLGFVADHDRDGFGPEGGGRPEDAVDEGDTTNGMKDLWRGRPHPGALARGQDDDVDGVHGRGSYRLQGVAGFGLVSEGVVDIFGR